VCRVALLGMIIILVVIAYYPFAWDPPRTVRNDVTRTTTGSLRFGDMNYARTLGTPAWLPRVRTSGDIQIQVDFNPQSPQVNSQASVMMLASDFWHADFAIVQGRSDLLVYLRRPGSDAGGGPPYVIHGVLRQQRWNNVTVLLRRDELRLTVGGRPRLTQHLPADSAGGWGPGQIVLGNEAHGGNAWLGRIGLAEVRTPGYAVDYVRPGALSIPDSYLYFPDHVQPFPPTNRGQWLLAFLDLLSFIPLGFLIVWARRPHVSTVAATVLAAALAVALAAGKFLFHGRHTSLVNVLMEIAGALLGALLASRQAHAKRITARERHT
jgi:VanZ family protein